MLTRIPTDTDADADAVPTRIPTDANVLCSPFPGKFVAILALATMPDKAKVSLFIVLYRVVVLCYIVTDSIVLAVRH